MGYFSNFERGQIVRERLAAASVTKTAILLRVSRATVYGYVGIHESYVAIVSGEEQWVKFNINRKKSLYIRKDFFRNITGRTAKLIIRLEDPVSTKTVQRELQKCNIYDRAANAKPLITESNAHMRKRWCHDHKTWTSDHWKRSHGMVT
jgi:hypothetical protein